MKKSVFFAGFGLSLVLIALCMWYAFASPMSRGVLVAFDVANRGWYVHQPSVYNICLLTFALLNLPVVFGFWLILAVVDATVTLSAVSRAIVTFASLIILSGGWWALLARWRWKRDHAAVSAP